MLETIKIGSNCLFDEQQQVHTARLRQKAGEIADRWEKGYKPILVVSGAIALAKRERGITRKNRDLPISTLQGLASEGQVYLMFYWQQAFAPYGMHVGQILANYHALRQGEGVQRTLTANLRAGVVSIVNDNDPVNTEETLADNDTLAAKVLKLMDADRLFLLGTNHGFYDAQHKLIPNVEHITPNLYSYCGDVGMNGNGGYRTKLDAAKIVLQCKKTMYSGHVDDSLTAIVRGKVQRTKFAR